MKIALAISLSMFVLLGKGQNLVPNPSFEIHTACPSNGGDITFASPWFQPCILGSSSDLFDTCGTNGLDVPYTDIGFQNPRTGNAYSGILFYSPGNGREYIEVGLTDSLRAGKKYCVDFYINLADSSLYAISNIGLYFSNDSILYYPNPNLVLPYTPQIINTSGKITDKQNWTLISGEYIATGGERFITIGNFYNDANTSLQNVGGSPGNTFSYYYIDDVSVTCCDPTGCTVSVQEQEANDVSVSTYSLSNTISFSIKGDVHYPLDVILYNTTGQRVKKETITSGQFEMNAEGLSSGIYFYCLFQKDGKLLHRGRLFLNNNQQ